MFGRKIFFVFCYVDSLFTTQAEREEPKRETIRDIPVAEISGLSIRSFQVRMDKAMQAFAFSRAAL